MAQQILIKNGRVWDGNSFIFADVLTDGAYISRIEPGITCEKAFVYDAAGKIVSAGLVDCHMHMTGLSGPEYAIYPEVCFSFGVTAAADAGSRLGDPNTVERSAVKPVVFADSKIENDHLDKEVTLERLRRYGNKAVGVKLFYDATSPNISNDSALLEACAFAREQGVKLMVHCSHSPTSMLSVVKALSPGDILSHVYHGGENDCLADDFAAFRLAREKGVIMDTACAGFVHTDFRVMRTAIAAGFIPDTISTDITCNSAFRRGGRYGLTMCMSMARTAGMAEEDIMRCVTSAPAKALGQSWGMLEPGGVADIAVLEYTDEPFHLVDKAGNVLESQQGYRCRMTVANGIAVYMD